MIRGLFARLTGEPRRGQALFDLAVAEARRPHWFVEGQVPDTLDGRFAMLATVLALLTVRLERDGAAGEAASVALTERFVESMDGELREMGVGDPALGRQVRGMVGALAARVGSWRSVVEQDGDWRAQVRSCLYCDDKAPEAAVAHNAEGLKALWARIDSAHLDQLADGRLA